MNKKSWYKSKTCWVGILEFIGGLAYALASDLKTGSYLTLAGVLMIVLRLLTKQGIKK